MLVLAVAIPAPWYIHQRSTYGGQPQFPQPAQGTARCPRRSTRPRLPTVVTSAVPPAPLHPLRSRSPTTALWGDYFGVWAWHADSVSTADATALDAVAHAPAQPRAPVARRARADAARRRRLGCSSRGRRCDGRRRSPSRSLPLLGLVGYLYFAVSYWTPDGDLLKATYMLDDRRRLGARLRLRARPPPRPLVARSRSLLLAVCALVELPFLVY